MTPDVDEPDQPVHLERRFGLLQATALNMANMVGVGPFITIPLLLTAMGGPHAMLGWLVAALVTIPDSLIWSELGAAMPGSGGSYVYLREGFGRNKLGRLVAFLFIWQFIISGPLEIASGYIGFSRYFSYLVPGLSKPELSLVAAAVGILTVVLLYRRIRSVAILTVSLWIGSLLTVGVVIVSGILYFDPKIAFDFPANALHVDGSFWFALGAAARVGVYDYLGYYDICYIGDEVKDPGRVIPRSVIISLISVAILYLGVNLSIIGVVPWQEVVPAGDKPQADFVVATMMQKLYGPAVAQIVTGMILWTALASVFALLLGYSRIPYAAAKDGYFFKPFAKLHPRGAFPYYSLLVLGAIAIGCTFVSLDKVIGALLATRMIVQFMGQVGAVVLLRRLKPDMERPYRIWLYPLPCILALVGWIFLYVTLPVEQQLLGVVSLAAGVACYLVWAATTRQWPFAPVENDAAK